MGLFSSMGTVLDYSSSEDHNKLILYDLHTLKLLVLILSMWQDFSGTAWLLEAIQAPTPLDTSFFKSLPTESYSRWAVYALVLEKANAPPYVYIGQERLLILVFGRDFTSTPESNVCLTMSKERSTMDTK